MWGRGIDDVYVRNDAVNQLKNGRLCAPKPRHVFSVRVNAWQVVLSLIGCDQSEGTQIHKALCRA